MKAMEVQQAIRKVGARKDGISVIFSAMVYFDKVTSI